MESETNTNTASNTTEKVRGKPFKKGDPRINRLGRPKSFDALRELAQQIANEVATSGGKPVVIAGHTCTNAEVVMRQWLQSGKPQLQQGFIEIAFGKVPTRLEIVTQDDIDKEIDDELAQLAASRQSADAGQPASEADAGGDNGAARL
jgi:isopentenyl phosphate kinase